MNLRSVPLMPLVQYRRLAVHVFQNYLVLHSNARGKICSIRTSDNYPYKKVVLQNNVS